MTVTERLMKPGSFRVELVNDYPASVAQAVAEYDHIVITPTRLQPIDGFSDANILAAACYTGVITAKPSPRIFEGSGLSYWLGTPEGLGRILTTAVTGTSQTLSQWITALVSTSDLTVGTVTNGATGTMTNSYQWMTRREAIDSVCSRMGAEWRINPDGTIDAAASGTLFVEASPSVVITRKEEGPDGEFRGLEGTLIVQARDVKQYNTTVYAVTQGADLAGTVTSATVSPATSYKNFKNNAVVMDRLVDAPTDPSGNAAAVAASVLGQFDSVRRELSLNSRTYNVTRFVEPGDTVYVYDQLAELTDSTNQIVYRGEVISPIELRVYALTWPIERGMGVYARRSGATPTYTDLTDYVSWEDGSDVVWEVGAASRPLADTAASTGSAAYLGANPAVAEAAATFKSSTYTPTLSNIAIGTGGGATNMATWSAVNCGTVWKMHIEGHIVLGSAGASVGAAVVGANLPSGWSAVSGSNQTVGHLTTFDAGTATYQGVLWVYGGTLRFIQQPAAGAYLTITDSNTTTPMTWVATDEVRWTADLHVTPS